MPGISLPQLHVCISLKGMQEKWGKKQDHTHLTKVCYELCKLSQSYLEGASGGEWVQSLAYKRDSFKVRLGCLDQLSFENIQNQRFHNLNDFQHLTTLTRVFSPYVQLKKFFYCNKWQLSPVLVVCTYKKYLPPLSHTRPLSFGD